MARENEVRLIGHIKSLEKDEENKMAQATMQVIRRNGRIDYPTIIVFPEHYDFLEGLKEDDFVLLKGFFGTMNISSHVPCRDCGKDIEDTSIVSSVIAIYIKKLDGEYSLDDFKEVSNSVNLLGPLCRNVKLKNLNSGVANAQYQMAVSRKIRIPSQESLTTDFPFISSLGDQATEDAKRMEEGSQCWVNGGVQTRQITAVHKCPHCNQPNYFHKNIMEVCPYSVEYLYNCKFDE